MKYTNPTVLSGLATGSTTGDKIDAGQLLQASFQFANGGDATAAGAMKIQMSNDAPPAGYIPDSFTPTNWNDVPSATSTITAGVGAPILLSTMAYRWIRVIFTRSAGAAVVVKVNMFAVSV